MIKHINTVNQSNDIRVVVLRSEGKYFCSGYDISEVKNSQAKGNSFGEMVDAIEQCRAVTVAAVQGGGVWRSDRSGAGMRFSRG